MDRYKRTFPDDFSTTLNKQKQTPLPSDASLKTMNMLGYALSLA